MGGGDFACAGSKIWVIRASMGNAYTSTRNQPRLRFVLFCSMLPCLVLSEIQNMPSKEKGEAPGHAQAKLKRLASR